MSKKEKSDALDALDVDVDASTRTIKAQFRRKAKDLQSGRAGVPASQKTFQELNEAYQTLIQNRPKHQIATKTVTVLCADVADYSRMMATNETGTLEFFNFCKEVFEEIVEKNQGRVFNTAGDAILAEFDYVFNAVQCAVEIQKELRAINLGQPEGQKVLFRMGINHGEVFMQEGDLLGDVVNIAARIQTAAKPGGICLSGDIYDLIGNKVSHTFTPLGKLNFKNIPEPIRTYALTEDDGKFKAPIPDSKIAAFEAQPRIEKVKRGEKGPGAKTGIRNGLLFAAALAAGGFFVWHARQSVRAAPSTAPASNEAAPVGHVFLATTPDSQVTLLLNGQAVFQGGTPLQSDLKPGIYKVHIENKQFGISEEEDLVVEAGKFVRFEKTFVVKKDGAAPSASSASLASLDNAPPSQVETEQKRQADQNNDAESAYRFGKSRVDKGKFDEAYIYLRIAATNGHGPAQHELGKLFYSGRGTPKRDFEASLYWLLKAALGGVKEATEFLAQNKFPQEFKHFIDNQRKIDGGNSRSALLRDGQRAFLEELKETLKDRNLPN